MYVTDRKGLEFLYVFHMKTEETHLCVLTRLVLDDEFLDAPPGDKRL